MSCLFDLATTRAASLYLRLGDIVLGGLSLERHVSEMAMSQLAEGISTFKVKPGWSGDFVLDP